MKYKQLLDLHTQVAQDIIENCGAAVHGKAPRRVIDDLQKYLWDAGVRADVVDVNSERKTCALIGSYPDALVAKKVLTEKGYTAFLYKA